MIYSLNEIDAQCKKAARGAGFEWGYAEDIGKAIRWLAAYDLPGTASLAAYLKEYNSHRTNLCQPKLSGQTYTNVNGKGKLCPILTGAWLCDSAAIEKNCHLHFENLSFPLLLMPFLSQIAISIQQSLTYEFSSTRLQFSNGILNVNDDKSLNCKQVEKATLTMNEDIIEGKVAAVVGQKTAKIDWDVLSQYAFKTYVPATEASRLGAGPSE